VELGVTPDPIPNSVVKPGNADDPQGVHRLEACATETKFLVFSTRLFFKLIDLTME
jgi:hypothetical protein